MRQVLKQFAVALALTLGVALTAATAQAATSETKRVSVTGEIVDTWCSVTMIMFAEGSGHYQCAVWCAAGGIPVSVKDEDDNYYVVLKVEGEDTNVASPSILRIQAH
jgi:hypothetical protein